MLRRSRFNLLSTSTSIPTTSTNSNNQKKKLMKNTTLFNQDEFWAWCADRGVSCRRPLEITSPTGESLIGRSLVLSSEPVERAGSVIAAIPYQNPINGKSIVLNAETLPLGCLPPLLPLPDKLFEFWRKRARKFNKIMKNNNNKNTDNENEYKNLLYTFGHEERKFIWLSGIIASAAADPTSKLYKYYEPYFNLMFSSPASFMAGGSYHRSKAITAFMSSENKDEESKMEFRRLEFLHQLASVSMADLMNVSATKKRRMIMTHSSIVSPSEMYDDDQNEYLDHLPSGELVYASLLRVLSHSITVGEGCPPTGDEGGEFSDKNNNNKNTSLSSSSPTISKRGRYYSTNDNDSDLLNEDDELEGKNLLPSMIPIVDLLNHSETPNCEVVTAESRVDGIRRVVILSRGPIAVDEPLTVAYNRTGSGVEEDQDQQQEGNNPALNKALTLFRFGF